MHLLFGHKFTLNQKTLYFTKEKTLKLMHFLKRNSHTGPIFKDSGILKIFDNISLGNCIFINNCINKTLPNIFHNWFTSISESHVYDTRLSEVGCLKIPKYNTKTYGRYSVAINAIYNWNFLQKMHKEVLFSDVKVTKLRYILKEYFRSKYC